MGLSSLRRLGERFTAPPPDIRGSAHRVRFRLLKTLLALAAVMVLGMLVMSRSSRGGSMTNFEVLTTALVFALLVTCVAVLSRRTMAYVAYSFTAVAIVAPCVATIPETDPVRVVGLLEFASPGILFAAFFLPPRAALVAVGLGFAASSTTGFVHPALPRENLYLLVGELAFVCVFSMLAALFQANWNRSITRAAAQAERTRQLQDLILGHVFDAVVVLDPEGRVDQWNEPAERLFGWSEEQVRGREVGVLFADATGSSVHLVSTEALLAAARDKAAPLTLRAVHASGRPFPVELAAHHVVPPKGRPADERYALVVRDLRASRAQEAQLRLQDRLASIGTLVAGVAHEINNPLAFMQANLGRLRSHLEADKTKDVQDALAHLFEGTERISTIVDDLRTFSRPDDQRDSSVELSSVVSSAVTLARHEAKHRADIETDLPEGMWVRGNRARLGQVFLNLVLNAVQALPADKPSRRSVVVIGAVSETAVMVDVVDEGVGVPADVLPSIFEPFITTKGREGTGLGLSICHRIITELGGSIEVHQTGAAGTTIRVELPLAEAAEEPTPARVVAAPLAAVRSAGQAETGRLRVMIVDDEPALAESIGWMLEPHYSEALGDGAAAARRFVAENWDVMVCDVTMPGANGRDVYRAVSEASPGAERRIVFMTGGAVAPWSSTFLAEVPNQCLKKPFSNAALRESIMLAASGLVQGSPGAQPGARL